MKISIIVPAYNEERLLGESLERIQAAAVALTRRGWETELIVCDNNSTDRTAEIARASGATVVFEPVNQIGRARNRGAAAAGGQWLVFVDADSHPGLELFEEMSAQIEAGDCLAGSTTIRLDVKHFLADWVVWMWNFASRRRRLLAGAFIFCEAAAFREVGGFSNELFAAEELELSGRLGQLARKTGKRVVVLHRHPMLTSGRKVRLYALREHLKFIVRVILDPSSLSRREACTLWYDGRR